MNKVLLVGVGPGDPEALTRAAETAIARADVVFAAQRHATLARNALALEPLADAPDRIRRHLEAGKRVVVLVSGDPCLYSLLGLLRRHLGDAVEVLPGVGAIQAFCARLGVLWQDAKIVSGHGRELSVSAFGHHVRTHRKTLLFCDAAHDPAWAARALMDEALEDVRMCAGERLSYPDERLTWGAPSELAGQTFDPLSLVWIENSSPASGLPPLGLDDEAFARGKIPMTKREIRVQVLAELELRPDSVVWDLGAGTGSVSVECARQCPLGQVFSVERKEEGVELIRENARRFHLNNLTVLSGVAPEACASLPAPTHVFIGGSDGHMAEIFRLLGGLPRPVRVVATAVTLESHRELLDCLAGLDRPRLCQIAANRMERLGRYHMFKPMNPVLVASGDFKEDSL